MTVFAANLISKGELQGRIREAVEGAIAYGVPKEKVIERLIQKFNLSEEVANKYYDEYALQTV